MLHASQKSKSQVHPLSVIGAAVVVLFLSGCSSSPNKDSAPATSSPFYTGKTSKNGGIQVNTLRTFGDSYTDFNYTDPRAQKNWSRELVTSGVAAKQENFAVGGAKAHAGTTNAFDRQIANWDATKSPVTERDLTVAYFGYNDIGRQGAANMPASKAGYSQAVRYLVDRGAATGSNRIFVTQIHDWSRNPGVNPAVRGQVIDWNNHVASVANSNPNIIAVDLYTVFNRVIDKPATFGLVNATEVDKERSYTDYLFFDSIHFGTKGQEIIARVFSHYLTRGWNWASALDAGGAATAQLNKDLDNNLLSFQYSQQPGTSSSPYRFIPLTTTQSALDRPKDSGRSFIRNQTRGLGFDTVKPLGLALDFAADGAGNPNASRMGLAVTQSAQSERLASFDEHSSMRFNSSAATLYWLKPHANFLFSTQLSRVNHGYDQTGEDDLVNRVVSNQRNGRTWAIEGKIRYTYRVAGTTFTPWASLSHQNHQLESGSFRSVYTTDVRFASARANDVYTGLGLDVRFDPLSLDGGKKLYLGGSLHHTESLRRDALTLQMREQVSPDINMSEIIERGSVRQTQLGINAQLEVSRNFRLGAAYAVDLQKPSASQAVRLTAGVQF